MGAKFQPPSIVIDPVPPRRASSMARALRRDLWHAQRSLSDNLSALGAEWRNMMRRLRKARVDYVVMPIGGTLPERSGPRRSFIERRLPLPPDPFSMQHLTYRLRVIADAPNVRGVLFVFRGFAAGPATLQNFRAAVARLRAAGKETVVYTPYLDLPHYYAATAAERIVAPPGAQFEVLGLYAEVLFFKDALARAGVEAEVVQISPYKTALDRFSRSEMSPEHRAQLDWLLDDQFDTFTADMAASRGLNQATVRELIDRAPFSVEAAQEAGLIDWVAYDDQLAELIGRERAERRRLSVTPAPGDVPPQPPPASLRTWDRAVGDLLEKPRRMTRRWVGVLGLEGMITMGPSRQPPIELPIPFIAGETAGEQTLVSILRQLEKVEDLAALVLYVNSGGGSALASELIGRQVEQFAARKPIVIYMGNVAASGGYYIAAPGVYIMSQTLTTTGSIGVITAKVNAAGLYDKLSVERVRLERGRHAGLYRDTSPLSEEERAIFERNVDQTYRRFVDVVARGRKLSPEAVDAIGRGRVWTGRQAREHALVDGHGDLLDAIKKAAELAALPTDDVHAIASFNIHPRSAPYIVYPNGAARLAEEAARLLTGEQLRALAGQPLLLLPYELRLW